MKQTPVIKSLDKMQKQYLDVINKLKIAMGGLSEIMNMTDGDQEYNASQFKWARLFAEATLDKIEK